jgi:hypothetical protein
MKPVNSKSLLHFVFEQMDKLDNGTIDVQQAREQSNLCKQANNILKYELDRSKVQMELTSHNAIYKDGLKIREVEAKNFDNTIDK